MPGTETVLVSNKLIFIFRYFFFSIAIFFLLSVFDLMMFWVAFGEGVIRYVVLHVKCSTFDPKSTCLSNLNFSKPAGIGGN